MKTESEQNSSNPAPLVPVTTTEAIYETNTEPLAYEDAVALAVANNNKIKMQEKSLKADDNRLVDSADKIDYIPTPGPNGNPEAKAAFNNYSQAQISYLISKKDLEVAKESVAYQVKKAIMLSLTPLRISAWPIST